MTIEELEKLCDEAEKSHIDKQGLILRYPKKCKREKTLVWPGVMATVLDVDEKGTVVYMKVDKTREAIKRLKARFGLSSDKERSANN